MGTLYGYIRVSTQEQNESRQLLGMQARADDPCAVKPLPQQALPPAAGRGRP